MAAIAQGTQYLKLDERGHRMSVRNDRVPFPGESTEDLFDIFGGLPLRKNRVRLGGVDDSPKSDLRCKEEESSAVLTDAIWNFGDVSLHNYEVVEDDLTLPNPELEPLVGIITDLHGHSLGSAQVGTSLNSLIAKRFCYSSSNHRRAR